MASSPIKRRIFIFGTIATSVAGCRDFSDIAGPRPDIDGGVDTNPPGDVGGDTNPGADTGTDTTPMDAGMDSGMDTGMDTAPSCGGTSLNYAVSNDHPSPHAEGLSFTIDHVNDGQDHTYNIQGASGHPHTITVSAAEFQMIASGQSVTVTSSNDAGHTHDVTLSCMPA